MRFASRTIRILDLLEWYEQGYLDLTPKFQRRDVWSPVAKSYFLDSLIRIKPTHKIFLSESIENNITKRDVVDGQQRLRSIINYCNDKIVILPKHNDVYGGLRFSQLPDEIRYIFYDYAVSLDVLYDASDVDILDLFARLNTYTVKLNDQELRNAQYHGKFKEVIYTLGQQSIDFFLTSKVFTAKRIVRMSEVELISELIIAMLHGLQDKKKSISEFYKFYNDEFSEEIVVVKQYWDIMDVLNTIFKESLINTKFSNKAPFYSLFLVLYDLKYGLPNQDGPYELSKDYSKAIPSLYKLSEQLKMDNPIQKYRDFKTACYEQTDNIKPRQKRHDVIRQELYSKLR